MKKIRIFFNILFQGIKGVWKNKAMGFASVISTAAVLIILGVVLVTALSVNVVLVDLKTKVDEIEVYLSDGLNDQQIVGIEENIKLRPGVRDTMYKNKEDALAEMKEIWGEESYILEGLEDDNPLERSIVVSVDDIQFSNAIVQYSKEVDGVTNVIYYQDAVNRLIKISDYVRLGGLIAASILVIIAVLVISNTVKLTVMSRKKEIEIMRYLGATNSMISGPFIIEGMLFGILGTFLAFIITYISYVYIYNNWGERLFSLISSHMIEPMYLRNDLFIIFCTLGIVIGTVGSVFSVKKYLKA